MSSPMIQRLTAALEGRYRIEDEIGEGGMATVYLAEDLKHHRKVALKVLKPDLAAVVGADRFLGEIQTTANLQHPHILPLFDSGEADGFLYYVMPYIEGETLRDRLDRERQLPVEEAVRIAKAVAEALQAAHDQGVIHRDIKPANVLMSRGQPLVADFGIALAVGTAGGRLTETGLSLGTPYYMSPEQATGDQNVGPATDLYAVGCVLHEMLVGDPPYTGSTAQAVLGKIIAGQFKAPREDRPNVPAHVDAVVRRALERLPADRFATAEELSQSLSDTSFRHGAVAAAVAGGGAGPWKIAAGALAVVTLGLVAAMLGRPEPQPPPRPGAERYFLTMDPTVDRNFALLPDGSGVVYSAPSSKGDGTSTLWLRRWANLVPQEMQGTPGPLDPSVSPDGTEVAFLSVGQLRVAPLGGGGIRTLTGEANCCVQWGPDGYIYYAAETGRGVARIPAVGGSQEVVTEVEGGTLRDGFFFVLPGEDVAVFASMGGETLVKAIRLSTGETRVLAPGTMPVVTEGGILVFASLSGALLAAPFDSDSLALTAAPVPVVEEVLTDVVNGFASFDLSASGDLLYWSGTVGVEERDLVWVTRDGTETLVDPNWRETFFTPAISPDGEWLAVAVQGPEGRDLWIKQLDRGPNLRITFPAGHDHRPWWFPDGRSLVFITERGPTRDAMIRRADGLGEAEVLLDLEDAVNQAFFSPDSAWLVYRTGRVDALDIFTRRVEGDTTTVPIADAPDINEHSPTLSPDGRWLAYVSDESGQWELYVRPFPNVNDGRWLVSRTGAIEPVWRPDGREIFYKSLGDERMMMATAVTPGPGGSFVVGESTALFSTEQYYAYTFNPQYDVTPDGQRFLLIKLNQAGAENRRLVLVRHWATELAGRFGGG